MWQSLTELPYSNPPIFLQWQFGAQLPYLLPANVSGYTVCELCSQLHKFILIVAKYPSLARTVPEFRPMSQLAQNSA